MGLIFTQCVLGNFQYSSVYKESSILYDCQHLYFEGI